MRHAILLVVVGLLLVVPVSSGAGSHEDGTAIVFMTNRLCVDSRGVETDCGRGEVAVVRPDGSHVSVLTHGGKTEASPAWSPDGRQIAFFRQPSGRTPGQVWLMNANGANPRPLTRLHEVAFYGDLAWAPSGRAIVFKAFPSQEGGQTDLWLADTRTGAVKRLTRSGYSEAAPSWSPDGRSIAFFTEGRLQAYQLWRLTLANGSVRRLTHGSAASLYPAWSPDSRKLAFTRGGKLAVMNADGTHLRVFSQTGVRPSWSPDGKWLVFASGRDLFKAHPDGTHRQRLTHAAAHVVNDQPNW